MEVRPGYKQTEVGVIPDDWDAVGLDTVCSMKSGEGITAARIDQFSQYPCYGGNGLRGYTSRFTHDGSFALIGRQGALCGNVVGADGKFFASEHAVVVTARSGTDIRFLTYVLGEMRLNRFSESSAQPGLSVSKVLKLPLATPQTEAEQRAIATALSDVDALLGGLDRLIAKKRNLKQAAMQQLLTGQTRLPGFHDEWEVKRLGEVANLYQPETISAKNFTESGYPVYGANGVVGYYHSANHTTWQVTVTCRGSTCGTVNRTVDECWITGNAMVLNCDQNPSIDKNFFYYLLLGQDLSDCITGTGQPQIVRSPLAAYGVSFPGSLSEQTAIAAALSDMDAELSALEARRDKTRDLKQAMMQELLTGRIRLV